MKNTLIFLFVLGTFIPDFGFSQYLIGVKTGYNFGVPIENSNTNPHHDADFSITQNSFLISTFLKSRIPGKVVNWGIEAEYHKTGLSAHQTVGGNGGGTIYDYDFSLHFLNLIFEPEFVFGSKWKFIINSGVYFGILLKVNTTGSWETYGFPPITSGEINETKNDYFNPVNFGFMGGIGTEYPVTDRIIIDLEANCTFGVTNLANSSLSEGFFNILNAQLSVGLAYKFNSIKNRTDKERVEW